jgi:hypothetical protein
MIARNDPQLAKTIADRRPAKGLAARLIRRVTRRAPDFVIGETRAYLARWWLMPRNRWCNVYLHLILASDDDRALHDHPWPNVSILLAGGYAEFVPLDWRNPTGPSFGRLHRPGDVIFRAPAAAHRLALVPGSDSHCWSLFITGPKVREWGFWCPQGWRHWRDFTNAESGGQGEAIGKGCGE